MAKDTNLQFIREKIYELRTAIMYSMSNEMMKIPNSIISAVNVDDEGQLWFLADRPEFAMTETDFTFPARLHFYKKGTFFHLEISGKAQVVESDANPIMVDSFGRLERKPLLIRMNMTNISYTEPHEKRKSSVEVLIEKGKKWVSSYIPMSKAANHAIH